MYCSKCGKEARTGDIYCSGCGSHLSKKKGPGKTLLLILVCVVLTVLVANLLRGKEMPPQAAEPVPEKLPVVATQSRQPQQPEEEGYNHDQWPQEPNHGDILENSDYIGGAVRRRVMEYSDCVSVTDYRPDGSLLRETTLNYSNGEFAGKRVTDYDTHGNPEFIIETLADGSLWLFLSYVNIYDEWDRSVLLAEYNAKGNPLSIRSYTYEADGSYRMDFEDYYGYVYEYDAEGNPEGNTTLSYQGYTTFNAQGDVIDQYISEEGGY